MKTNSTLGRIKTLGVALASGVLLFAGYSLESAANPCASYESVQDIISAGNTCEIGDKTFSGFSVSGDLSASQVEFAVINGPVFWGFDFSFDLNAGLPGDGSNDFTLVYDVSCTDKSACIDSVHADILGGVSPPTAIGIGQMTETYLPGKSFTLCFGDPSCVSSIDIEITPVSTLHLKKDLNVKCISGAPTSGVCSISFSAMTNTVDQVSVPEPGTLALLAGGLLALGWTGRRRRGDRL